MVYKNEASVPQSSQSSHSHPIISSMSTIYKASVCTRCVTTTSTPSSTKNVRTLVESTHPRKKRMSHVKRLQKRDSLCVSQSTECPGGLGLHLSQALIGNAVRIDSVCLNQSRITLDSPKPANSAASWMQSHGLGSFSAKCIIEQSPSIRSCKDGNTQVVLRQISASIYVSVQVDKSCNNSSVSLNCALRHFKMVFVNFPSFTFDRSGEMPLRNFARLSSTEKNKPLKG